MKCQICGQSDLFSVCSDSRTCAVCSLNFTGPNPTEEIVKKVRSLLKLKENEYLKQDYAAEAARILGYKK